MADAIVIKFPVRHLRPEILSDEIAKRNEAAKVYYVEDITARFIEQAAEAFLQMGIDIDEEAYVKDFAYFQLVTAGIFARSAQIEHEIHGTVALGRPAKDEEGNEGYVWPSLQEKRPKKPLVAAVANTAVSDDSC